ncbi:conserved hypothetical protein [Trichinella spiralis]|uniref:hypothetical protein n=1 Tax=Trichinella spiralis TaxID=6334 RepID=UPI0001EFE517|nr:conserved hypothetical protein [Trichinella spiralis]
MTFLQINTTRPCTSLLITTTRIAIYRTSRLLEHARRHLEKSGLAYPSRKLSERHMVNVKGRWTTRWRHLRKDDELEAARSNFNGLGKELEPHLEYPFRQLSPFRSSSPLEFIIHSSMPAKQRHRISANKQTNKQTKLFIFSLLHFHLHNFYVEKINERIGLLTTSSSFASSFSYIRREISSFWLLVVVRNVQDEVK